MSYQPLLFSGFVIGQTSGGGGGVSSLNGITGAITLVAGTGITLVPSGGNITINSIGASGTVTSVSVVSANGISGTVANPTTTPALTITSTLSGDVTGPSNSNSLTATSNSTLTTLSSLSLPYSQVTGTPTPLVFSDSLVNTSGTVTLVNDTASPAASQYYGTNGSSILGYYNLPSPGTGTVTSVGFADTSTTPIYTITNSPITTSGTIDQTLNTQNANLVFAGPSSGSAAQPTFRALVSSDIPTLNQNTTGTASNITATTNSTLTTLSSLSLPGSQVAGDISGNAANVTGTVAIANGGTGQTTANAAFDALSPMTTTGDMIYENSTPTAARLPIGTTGQYLTVASGIPSWTTVSPGTPTVYAWSGYHSGSSSIPWALTISSTFADPTNADSTLALTQLNNSNFGTVASYGGTGASTLPGIVFTPAAIGLYYVKASFNANVNATINAFRLWDGTNEIDASQVVYPSSPLTDEGVILSGLLNITSLVSTTISIQSAGSAGGGNMSYAASVVGAHAIDWTIFKIN